MHDLHHRAGFVFVAVIVGHVILISAQVNSPSGMRVLDSVVFTVFSEVQRAVARTLDGVRRGWSGYVALRDAEGDNAALRREVTRLRVQVQAERALASRSRRLQRLLGARHETALDTLAATIISADPTLWFQTVTIDRGARDGLRADLAVIAAEGVVGRTFGTMAPGTARVQLLIDGNAAAAALIERTRVAGIVHGGGGHKALLLEYVSKLADVRRGDVIVTSGIDGIYPKGFRIGRVESAKPVEGLYQEIKVAPAVDFSALEEVLVVTDTGNTGDEEEGAESRS